MPKSFRRGSAALIAACIVGNTVPPAAWGETDVPHRPAVALSTFESEAIIPRVIAAFHPAHPWNSLSKWLARSWQILKSSEEKNRYEMTFGSDAGLIDSAVRVGRKLGRIRLALNRFVVSWNQETEFHEMLPQTFWDERIEIAPLTDLYLTIDQYWASLKSVAVHGPVEQLRAAKFDLNPTHRESLLDLFSKRDRARIDCALYDVTNFFQKKRQTFHTLIRLIPLDAESAQLQLVFLSDDSPFKNHQNRHIPIESVFARSGELSELFWSADPRFDLLTIVTSDPESKGWFGWRNGFRSEKLLKKFSLPIDAGTKILWTTPVLLKDRLPPTVAAKAEEFAKLNAYAGYLKYLRRHLLYWRFASHRRFHALRVGIVSLLFLLVCWPEILGHFMTIDYFLLQNSFTLIMRAILLVDLVVPVYHRHVNHPSYLTRFSFFRRLQAWHSIHHLEFPIGKAQKNKVYSKKREGWEWPKIVSGVLAMLLSLAIFILSPNVNFRMTLPVFFFTASFWTYINAAGHPFFHQTAELGSHPWAAKGDEISKYRKYLFAWTEWIFSWAKRRDLHMLHHFVDNEKNAFLMTDIYSWLCGEALSVKEFKQELIWATQMPKRVPYTMITNFSQWMQHATIPQAIEISHASNNDLIWLGPMYAEIQEFLRHPSINPLDKEGAERLASQILEFLKVFSEGNSDRAFVAQLVYLGLSPAPLRVSPVKRAA